MTQSEVATSVAPQMHNRKLPKGTLPVVLFVAVPLVIWILALPPALSTFASLDTALYYLGKTLGVAGFSLFTVTLLIAIRLPVLERIFGDLAHAYKFHQTLGALTLIVLSWHPILQLIPYLQVSTNVAARFLLSFADIWQFCGLMALIVFEVVIVLTYFIRLPYQTWKTIHKFMGLAFVLAGTHVFFIDGDIKASPLLHALFFAFLLLGICVIFARVLFSRTVMPKIRHVVDTVEILGGKGEFTRVTLRPESKGIDFKAGQFAYVTPLRKGMSEEHPFSLCAPEGSEKLVFTMKNVGDFTAKLPTLKPGDIVLVEGPFGRFSYLQGGKKQIWIAGGSGVTPFLSLAQSLDDEHDVTMFYSVKEPLEAVGLDKLQAVQAAREDFQVISWVTSEHGYLNAEALKKECGDLAEFDIFICGPRPMMDAMTKQLVSAGVHPARIHMEAFSLLPSELQ